MAAADMPGRSGLSTAVRYGIVATFLVFMIVPLVATALFSVSVRWDRTLWPEDYTLDWWIKVTSKRAFRTVFCNSLAVSAATVAASLLLVAPAAYLVHSRLPRFKPVMEILAVLPFGFPAVVLALGLLRLYAGIGFPLFGTTVLLVAAYVVVTLPFMYRPTMNALEAIDIRVLSEAAQSLGAGDLRIFLTVIVPNIRHGLVNGSLLVFSAAFAEFALANLLVGTRFKTFPIYLVEFTRFDARQASALALISFVCAWAISLVLLSRSGGKRMRARPGATAKPNHHHPHEG